MQITPCIGRHHEVQNAEWGAINAVRQIDHQGTSEAILSRGQRGCSETRQLRVRVLKKYRIGLLIYRIQGAQALHRPTLAQGQRRLDGFAPSKDAICRRQQLSHRRHAKASSKKSRRAR